MGNLQNRTHTQTETTTQYKVRYSHQEVMTQCIVRHNSRLAQYRNTKHKSSRRRVIAIVVAVTLAEFSDVQNDVDEVAYDRSVMM
jgi:hypothetical protein